MRFWFSITKLRLLMVTDWLRLSLIRLLAWNTGIAVNLTLAHNGAAIWVPPNHRLLTRNITIGKGLVDTALRFEFAPIDQPTPVE